MDYRLALDVGSNSIGWAIFRLRLDSAKRFFPMAIIRSGVRIFSDGRKPKEGTSLAATRRQARSARRRRDRLLQRKNSMLRQLVRYGFFPKDEIQQKALVRLNPYALRAKGLDEALTPEEFGRALFHINQRRGFKSNRKTDKVNNDSSVMKAAIADFKEYLKKIGQRTVGEALYHRMRKGETVRARLRTIITQENDHNKSKKSYDFYMDRSMVEDEFEQLWSAQQKFNSELYNEDAKQKLKHTLLFQRPLKPVDPGRCTFLTDEKRAAVALPLTQQFRIYQTANHLRYLNEKLIPVELTFAQRNLIIQELEKNKKRTFHQLREVLNFSGSVQFSSEDEKNTDVLGNYTSATLSHKKLFGDQWFNFSLEEQTEIVKQLLNIENESELISWLCDHTGVAQEVAQTIANAPLQSGYASLSEKALDLILPKLKEKVITYDKAVVAAGFKSHSDLTKEGDKEALKKLPYYGEMLQRYVGFGTNNPDDVPEKRYGKINNPTVHIGLNQVRGLINQLIKEYGHPTQVVIELARDLKRSKHERERIHKEQTANAKKNEERRKKIAELTDKSEHQVSREELQKMILWEELAFNPMDRACPYSGEHISKDKLYSAEVEIEHILPFSRTLDDSMNNKTLALRKVNQLKANKTPYEAFGSETIAGYKYEDILLRVKGMKKEKIYRFAPDGLEQWRRQEDFLARALNDTRYLSVVVKAYVEKICPSDTWVIPGQLTAMIRRQFGLNHILDLKGEKNRHDHRHHAIDACVIGVTDRSLLKRIAETNNATRSQGKARLLEDLELPWSTYQNHVLRAIEHILVSHKPDHGYQGAMHNATAYGLLGGGQVLHHKLVDGKRVKFIENLQVIPITNQKAKERHGVLPDGSLKPYKGYEGGSNYCIEIFTDEKGKWQGNVVSTFEAYQIVRKTGSTSQLRHKYKAQNGRTLVMRLMRGVNRPDFHRQFIASEKYCCS